MAVVDPPPTFLPYGRQSLDANDIAAVVAVLRGDFLTQGSAVERFEADIAATTGARHAVSCSSGTAALHLAYAALDFKPGDAVLVPAITFLATASAAFLAGATVVFADVDPDSGLLTPEHAEEAARRAERAGLRVRAAAPVHLAGQSVDMAGLARLASARGWRIVEDACHALGGADAVHEAPVGACAVSAMTVFSFHPVKTVTAGEGGAITTNDDALANRLRRLRNHGMQRDPNAFQNPEAARDDAGNLASWYYEMSEPGWNYRLTDIQAALGSSQLRRLADFVAQRERLRTLYEEALAPLTPVARPTPRRSWSRPSWHLFVALIDFAALGLSRQRVMARLRAAGIGSQVHYIPLHHQPFWAPRHDGTVLAGAEAYYARCLSLPLFIGMEDRDVGRVAAALAAAFADVTAPARGRMGG